MRLWVTPGAWNALPPAASYIAENRIMKIEVGKRWMLDVMLDNGKQGVMKSFEHDLPLVLHL